MARRQLPLAATWRRTSGVIVAAALILDAGCARPDWIEQTLVTADVTGEWSGSCGVAGGGSVPTIGMTLEQDGPKVTGRIRTSPGRIGDLSGTVSGDVLRYSSGAMEGTLKVSGDEMSGWISTSSRLNCQLRRLSETRPK